MSLYRIDINNLQIYYKEIVNAILLNYSIKKANWEISIKESLTKY
jgi:hypothetical protein